MVDLKQTQAGLKMLDAIPLVKRRRMHWRTLAGVAVFGGAWLLPKLGFPWQASLGVAAFGGWIASQQLVTTYLKTIPAFIADLVNALKGQKPNGAPHPPQ